MSLTKLIAVRFPLHSRCRRATVEAGMKIKKPRYKNSPLSIEEAFPPPHENVKIIPIAHLADLSDLAIDYYENPEELGELFLNHFGNRASYEILIRSRCSPLWEKVDAPH